MPWNCRALFVFMGSVDTDHTFDEKQKAAQT